MKGLYHKYNVTKADGSPVDPDAYYLVLRLDAGEYRDACRAGARSFAKAVEAHNPQLAADILDTLPELEDELEASRARVAELDASVAEMYQAMIDYQMAVDDEYTKPPYRHTQMMTRARKALGIEDPPQ